MISDIRRTQEQSIESILLESLEQTDGRMFTDRYVGIVVNNNDPDKRARCQIRVIGVFEPEIIDADLPWAYRGDVNGDFIIPKVGDRIYVGFEGGNRYSPYWTDPFQPINVNPTSLIGDKVIDSKYPNTVVELEDKNQRVTYDQETGAYHFFNMKFGHLVISKDGDITIGATELMGESVDIGLKQVNVNIAELNMDGSAITDLDGSGPFCATPFCPYTGLSHVGNIVINPVQNASVERIRQLAID